MESATAARGADPSQAMLITAVSLQSSNVYLTSFWFFRSPRGETVGRILTLNTSYDAVLSKEVPLGVRKYLTYLFEKLKKYIVAYGEQEIWANTHETRDGISLISYAACQ